MKKYGMSMLVYLEQTGQARELTVPVRERANKRRIARIRREHEQRQVVLHQMRVAQGR